MTVPMMIVTVAAASNAEVFAPVAARLPDPLSPANTGSKNSDTGASAEVPWEFVALMVRVKAPSNGVGKLNVGVGLVNVAGAPPPRGHALTV